jgi:hypothetical protein
MLSSPVRDHGYAAATASDQALMGHIAGGDADAFEELYRRHSRHALMQARKLCASSQQAEDVAQETFFSLCRSAHRYRPPDAAGRPALGVRRRARYETLEPWWVWCKASR